MRPPLVADTGGLLRALAGTPQGAASWPACEKELREASCVVVPALILPEVDHFLGGDRATMRALIADLFDPRSRYRFEPATPADLVRAMEFDAKFADLKLGLVDGTVAAVAERLGIYRVLTNDRRDFGVLRVGRRYDRALTIVP